MNELIKKLALQAGGSHYPEVNSVQLEKFAELIVRECAEICLEANDYKNILRYFGVEE
jgi:hypothetical protein